ncbi:hypothetical protein TRFO_16419 [Tritrichomonas foetus]|uniref:Uncharacterized protein n=1 Tax=Tritrichomonas foetus TaxID=1144522 RepID=A0A1J4KQ52_9EUKA|nr:hypothetical protein TRFO_16419 [Tritrichomonas foetus]|eukprot:OHT13433.1 hypothetical protein TRFO_16419 [Tritrichomonas foetus]
MELKTLQPSLVPNNLPNSPPEGIASIPTTAVLTVNQDSQNKPNTTYQFNPIRQIKTDPRIFGMLLLLLQQKNNAQLKSAPTPPTQEKENSAPKLKPTQKKEQKPLKPKKTLSCPKTTAEKLQSKKISNKLKSDLSNSAKTKKLTKTSKKVKKSKNIPTNYICTPAFDSLDIIPKSSDISESFDFDIFSTHRRLEICENRIVNGRSTYLHPGYVIEMEEKELLDNLTYEEEKLTENYVDHIYSQKVPLFWEKRSWDQENDAMDSSESEKLNARIRESEEVTLDSNDGFYGTNKRKHKFGSSSVAVKKIASNSISCKNEAPRTNPKSTVLSLSNLFYGTDNSDEETDGEFF